MFKNAKLNIRAKLFQDLHPAQIIIFSFLSGIVLGGFLLMLPMATIDEPLKAVDAFFTSTSAICVTGLIVVDTGTHFSTFGQIVILCLIQIGGLGLMVFSTFFILAFGKSLSIKDRFMAKESLLGQISFNNLFSVIKHILIITFSVELIGAVLLFLTFSRHHEMGYAIYTSLFHSISGFCNAGFSLYTLSLMGFSNDIFFNIVMAGLIISGGLGFPVLYELRSRFFRKQNTPKKFSLHCKIVLITTAVLLLVGTVFLYLLEIKNPAHHATNGLTLIEAFFQSVTARTAGFNTVSIDNLTNPSLFLMIVLMFIGGSPASTAGGIKTTSLAVFFALVRSIYSGKDKVNIFKRSIPNEIIYKMLSIILGSIFLIICVNIVLQITESGFLPHDQVEGSFLTTLFEATSAFGTVGLSMGVTSLLSVTGKIVLMLTMLIGRIGPLTFALAIIKKVSAQKFEYPEDSPMIG